MDLLTLLVVVLVVAWIGGIGFGGPMAVGGLVHLLLLIAVIVVVVRLARGERL